MFLRLKFIVSEWLQYDDTYSAQEVYLFIVNSSIRELVGTKTRP